MIEGLIELLFEIFGEALLQIVMETVAEAGLHAVRRPDGPATERSPWLLATGYALAGLAVGGVSLLIAPASFARGSMARVATLVAAPLLAAASVAAIGMWRARRGQALVGINRFVYAYLFAFTAAFVRFMFTS